MASTIECKNCSAEVPVANHTIEVDDYNYVDLQFHCDECGKRTWTLIKPADLQEDI